MPSSDQTLLHCGDSNVFNIKLHGKHLGADHIINPQSTLQITTTLTQAQFSELMDAYAEEGIRTFQTCKKVKFFRAVSYCVRDRVFEDGEDIEDYTANKGITQLRIHVGDIIEFRADWEPDERGFARVFGIMLHERNVFLVVGWILPLVAKTLLSCYQSTNSSPLSRITCRVSFHSHSSMSRAL